MGSIRGSLFLVFLFILFPLFAQNGTSESVPLNTVTLASEISRLEKIASGSGQASSPDRYSAAMALVRLYRLSGDSEAALKAGEGALKALPGDGRALLEQARLLLSLGEYDKANAALTTLLSSGQEQGLLIQGRYLGALLTAFRSGNTQPLAALASDPDYAEYLGGIYYTLWKLSSLSSWKTRLTTELPRSPEAKIAAASQVVDSAPTPLWLLFPGRDSITLSGTGISSPIQVAVSPPAPSRPPPQTESRTALSNGNAAQPAVLQTGLFSREENARAMAERLNKAGFTPQVSARKVNGKDYWAVTVNGGKDTNTTIKKLKDSGFEAFPVKP